VRQLRQDPHNFIIAVVRDPSAATLKPFLGANVVAVKADLLDLESFPVCD
jgi:uncharacterized protein YbjT (DUF2867 family)